MEKFFPHPTSNIDGLVVVTDNRWRPFLTRHDVPKKELDSHFDYLDEDEYDGFVKFKGHFNHTSEFTRIPKELDGALSCWDGKHDDSWSSGTLLAVSKDGEEYKIGFYYVSSEEGWKKRQSEKKSMRKNGKILTVAVPDIKEPVPIANPFDYENDLYLFGFGAYGDTHVLVFGRGVEAALEESAGFLKDNGEVGHFTDDDILRQLAAEAREELGPDASEDDVMQHAEADLTYTESGYLTSYEWTVDDVTDPKLLKAARDASEEYVESGAHFESNPSEIKLGEHISHNFFRVSDKDAGKLARDAGKPLPKHGYELSVQLPTGQMAWLIRTPTRSLPGYPARGWVWAVHSGDRIKG